MTDFLIELQAYDRSANRFWSWCLHAGEDLFGLWHARVTCGPIGGDGRTVRYDFADAVFGVAHPKTVVLTTPNAEYNARYETLDEGELRHAEPERAK